MFDNFFGRFVTLFIERNGFKLLLDGLKNTLIISFVALIIGIVIGALVAIVKVSKINPYIDRPLNIIADTYIAILRGTPVVVQLLFVYYAILSPLGISPLFVCIIVFGMNSSAYVAEIIRSGILSIDRGQMEAGRSLGLSYGASMAKIVLPQAIKNIIPALGNELIVLIKETSVAGFITVVDLTKAAQAITSSTYDFAVPYTVLALVYLIIVLIATYLVGRLERWMRRSDYR